MRRFLFLLVGLGLVGCVGETDPNMVDDVSDAVETTFITSDSVYYAGDRRTPAVLGVEFGGVGVARQAVQADREQEVNRPPPTPLRPAQPAQASPPWPVTDP